MKGEDNVVGIYKMTNKINGKIYIGQSIDIEKRIKEHFWKATNTKDVSYNSAIHQAIRKYGQENFTWEVLEECDIDVIDKKETEYIQQYNSLTPNGYNILTGGQKIRAIPKYCSVCGKQITGKGTTGKCFECHQKESRVAERPTPAELEDLLKQYNFVKVGKMFGVSDTAIRKWCKGYGMSTKAKDYK